AEKLAMDAQRERVRALGGVAKKSPTPQRSGSHSQATTFAQKIPGDKRQRILMILGAGAVVLLLLPEQKPTQNSRQVKQVQQRDLAAYLPEHDPSTVGKTAQMFFK